MADWWDKGTKIPLNDANFQKIIDFYLFNCPCETESGSVGKGTKKYTKVSKRGTTLRAQGWTKGFLNTLLAAMKKTVSGHLEYHPFEFESINFRVCTPEFKQVFHTYDISLKIVR